MLKLFPSTKKNEKKIDITHNHYSMYAFYYVLIIERRRDRRAEGERERGGRERGIEVEER